MAIGTISSVVYSRVPWLVSPTDDAKVDTFILQVEYTLQPYLEKTDAQVEDESTYTNREKLLTGLYSAYNLVTDKIIENTGGVDGESPTGNKIIKKAKADVTEAEFHIPKASEGGLLISTAENIALKLKKEICGLATTMKLRLPLCKDLNNECVDSNDVGVVPFAFGCGLNKCNC